MKNFPVNIVLAALLSSLCGVHGLNIVLSALRPDLEYLRGYWLQNPTEHARLGRITFANETQILVDFESTTTPIHDEAWTKDFLRLKGIYEMPKNPLTAFDELFYKQGSFYVRRNPYALPEYVFENDYNWISTLPIGPEDDGKDAIEVHYTHLNSLAAQIDTKVDQMERSGVPVEEGESRFPFDFVKGRMQLFVRHVRIIEFVPTNDYSDIDVNYLFSREMPFIRYDRNKKHFYSAENTELDDQGLVRSSVGNYTLKNAQPDEAEYEESETLFGDDAM